MRATERGGSVSGGVLSREQRLVEVGLTSQQVVDVLGLGLTSTQFRAWTTMLKSTRAEGLDWSGISDWIRRGFTPLAALIWLRAGADAAFADEAIERGLRSDEVEGFAALGQTPLETSSWVEVGCEAPCAGRWLRLVATVSDALGWIGAGYDPDSAEPWIVAGTPDSSVVQRWIDARVPNAVGQHWIHCGVLYPEDMFAWDTEGFAAEDAGAWTTIGIGPAEAVAFRRIGVGHADLRPFVTGGSSVAMALLWLRSEERYAGRAWPDRVRWASQNVRPTEAQFASDLGFRPADIALLRATARDPMEWLVIRKRLEVTERTVRERAGPLPFSAWRREGGYVSEAAAWMRKGIGLGLALGWLKQDLRTPEQALPWRSLGFGPEVAGEWLFANVKNPVDARELSRQGVRPAVLAEYVKAGVHREEALRWIAEGFDDSGVRWARAGLQPLTVRRLGRAQVLDALFVRDLLAEGLQPEVLSDLDVLSGNSWAQLSSEPPSAVVVRQWIADARVRADRRQREQEEARRSRVARDAVEPTMSRTLRLGARSNAEESGVHTSPARKSEFKAWLQEGDSWIAPLRLSASQRQQLRYWFSVGLRWRPPNQTVFGSGASDGWLRAEVEHLSRLRPYITREPLDRETFQSDSIEVELMRSGHLRLAWVGRNGVGLLTAIEPGSFELRYRPDDADARYAAGMALAWYLDCAITLHQQTLPSTIKRIPASPGGAGLSIRSRYVPQPSFRDHVMGRGDTSHVPRLTHQVRGHLRTLPTGFTPDPTKRRSAPEEIRRNLGPNDTFVREHARGSEAEVRQVLNRLSQYSSLAEALSNHRVST